MALLLKSLRPLSLLFLTALALRGFAQSFPLPVTTVLDPEKKDLHPQFFCAERMEDGRIAFGTR
ncbi:MAG: hypothetical protein ABEH38_01400, partial [Flavobacteriales bacterium]